MFYLILYYFMRFVNIIYDFLYNRSEVIYMKPLKEKISITIDSDLLEKIKTLAENDDRSLSQYINIVLKEHLNKKKK